MLLLKRLTTWKNKKILPSSTAADGLVDIEIEEIIDMMVDIMVGKINRRHFWQDLMTCVLVTAAFLSILLAFVIGLASSDAIKTKGQGNTESLCNITNKSGA